MDPRFHGSKWYQAATLKERVESFRAVGRSPADLTTDTHLAERRMNRWRSQHPFKDDLRFREYLAGEGIHQDELRCILAELPEAVESRFLTIPEWLADLAAAFSQPFPADPLPYPQSPADEQTAAFLEALEAIDPLIRHGRTRLREEVNALLRLCSDLPFDPQTIVDTLYVNLPGRLLQMLSRTLVLELNVARLEGLLQGQTPQERFRSFINRLRQPDVIVAVLNEYPALARQLMICIDNWVKRGRMFLRHLIDDWDEVRTLLDPGIDRGVLVEVKSGAGDRHRGGQSVLLLRFSSGAQLVYKPRSLAADIHFQQLLKWLNERGNHSPFRTLKVLDRGDHGWMEFVSARSCTSLGQVERFYERMGGYLALLYALEATDFHCENVIASGEHPVLPDLETIFVPRVQPEVDRHEAAQIANGAIESSVLRVMLLPRRFWETSDSEGIDISGFTNKKGQLTPYAVPLWEETATDEMRLIRKQIVMGGDNNTPDLDGNGVHVWAYREAVVRGFTAVYRLMERHRDELLSDAGPLAAFGDDEIRVVLRPTQTYASLLRESYHPDLLRNALERDGLFDRLWFPAEHLPHLRSLIAAEREDLHRGDIPMFTTRPDSRELWSSPDKHITGVLEETGMTMVRTRVQRLSEGDLARQIWFIRSSLATTTGEISRPARIAASVDTTSPAIVDRAAFLQAACDVADHLEALAIRGRDDTTWIGLSSRDELNAAPLPLGTDLYDGLPGVALFLAYAGTVAGEARYTSLARSALTALLREMKRIERGTLPAISGVGAFTGWGGLIYTLTHLGVLWQDDTLLDQAAAFVEFLAPLISQDSQLDILNGAAGAAVALLALYRVRPSERTLAAAIECGRHVCNRSFATGHTPLLTGFSHGAAGMAWALLQLAFVTGDRTFRSCALDLIAHERSLFNPDRGNWPDLRCRRSTEVNEESIFKVAWCHGAPGIGLARLGSLEFLDDSEIRAEIDTALRTTLAEGFGGNHSLCHGDLGNIELLLQAKEAFNDPALELEASRLATAILRSFQKEGWLCGVPLTVETPGLMTGLAGIGYGCLRLANPARVPSLLVLDAPR